MMRDERFENLRSNFHIIADPLYFDLDRGNPYHVKIIELITKVAVSEDIECFFPVQAKEFIDGLQLKGANINYYFSGCKMYENYKKKIDYTKSVPGFSNVVQYAITLAIYCGFSEIYLIGCDMTGYKEIEEKAYGNYEEDKHCYHLTEEEKRNVLHKERSCEAYFQGFANMFTDYRRLAEYTKKRNIKLINATEGGVLDSLPRESYDKLVEQKTNGR